MLRKKSANACCSSLVILFLVLLISPVSSAITFQEFDIPTIPATGNGPIEITVGPDGNLWFTESDGNRIGKITTAGVITDFPVPTPFSNPARITAGPDGNLWFTETLGNKIGRITLGGIVSEFSIPTPGSRPAGITSGPDGNLWFAENLGDKIGRITPSGVISEFAIPTRGGGPAGITAGPDGNLWFTENSGDKIGRITPAGTVTEFPMPTLNGRATRIAVGPDGNLWYTLSFGNVIGRITTAGVITEFPLPIGGSLTLGIVSGPDGKLWFAERSSNSIGSITTNGVVTEFPVPTPNAEPTGIISGPDANIWFTERTANKIGRLVLTQFVDVPSVYWAYNFVTAVSNAGITGGCSTNPPRFCPDDRLTRAQMAVFVETSLGVNLATLPACSGALFNDVNASTVGDASCRFIEDFAARGITGGCSANPSLFCPNDVVTRQQMAVFIEAALGRIPGQLPPACSRIFTDIKSGTAEEQLVCRMIEDFAALGITGGCSSVPPLFCPDTGVTRAEMAVFLVAAPVPLSP